MSCMCSSHEFKSRKKKPRPLPEKDENGRTDLRQTSPQLHLVNVEKYFRRFNEIPPDFVQTSADPRALVTKDDIMEKVNPLRVKQGRHIMLVGGPITSKASVAQKIAEMFADEYHTISTCHSMFIIDFRQHPGNPETTVGEFLYQTRPDWFDYDSKQTMAELMRKTPFKALFVFLGLDTVPFDFTPDYEVTTDLTKAKTSVILHNILGGTLFPCCKILSACREYRVREFKGVLRPDHIVQVGELTDESVEWMARELLGLKLYKDVVKVWTTLCTGMVGVINRTVGFYLQNLMSGAKGNLDHLAHTVPMCTLHLFVCCLWGSIYVPEREEKFRKRKREVLPIFNKIKQIAYHAFIEGRVSFSVEEVEERFGLTVYDINKASVGYPNDDQKRYRLLEGQYKGRLDFINRQAQEFLCAIVVVELSLDEYKAFLTDSIHVPRCHVVRRMVCGLVLDKEAFNFAHAENITSGFPHAREIEKRLGCFLQNANSRDLKTRRKLLEASMSAEFPKLKRQDLLEFLRAVGDAAEGGTGILPKSLDVMDFSHIQLFSLDMHAIAWSLAGGKTLGHLNLANCDITDEGLCRFAKIAEKRNIQVDKLTLDWNTEWMKTSNGITGLRNFIVRCKVVDLSINHNDITPESLKELSNALESEKLPTLRICHNAQLCNNKDFPALLDFAFRHSVKNLYITTEKLTVMEFSSEDGD